MNYLVIIYLFDGEIIDIVVVEFFLFIVVVDVICIVICGVVFLLFLFEFIFKVIKK